MKQRLWILIDVSFLCYKALYSTGHLKNGSDPTGVLFSFLRDVLDLDRLFEPDGIAFCFDSKSSRRKDVYPTYKANRVKKPEEQEMWKAFFAQRNMLRTQLLPELGYQNIFCQKGYEADDLIASLCETIPSNDIIVIVSGDKDLYQCLSTRTTIYNMTKQKHYGWKSFRKEYGISPLRWAEVKAFSGCSSDNVKGIKGVGDITVCKWIRGELKPGSAAYEKMVGGMKLFKVNKPLVTLPYEGTKKFELVRDTTAVKHWRKVAALIGSKTLAPKKERTTKRRMGGRRYAR